MSGYQRFELEIASIGIEIDSSIPAELSTRCRLFIKAGIESDVQFKIRTGRHNWNDYEIVNTQVSARIRRKGENILKVQYEDGSFRKVRWISRWKKQERLPEAPCLYEIFVPEMSDCIRNINPLMFVELSEFFLRFSAVILHCSIVNFMEDGILFTAPSGTGKSTLINALLPGARARTGEISARAREMGVKDCYEPVMTLVFLSLLVIPKLKLSDKGLFDVEKFRFTSLEVQQ